jgi:hypothetical protein
VALASGDELLHRLAVGRQAGQKQLAVPRAQHDRAAVARELVGEILCVADAEDLRRRVEPQTPGRESDRGHQGFQMPRWQVDDEPLDPAFTNRCQLGGDDFEMPVHRQAGLWIEVAKAARDEGGEVVPKQDLVLGRGQAPEHDCPPFENRARSCSMTSSS